MTQHIKQRAIEYLLGNGYTVNCETLAPHLVAFAEQERGGYDLSEFEKVEKRIRDGGYSGMANLIEAALTASRASYKPVESKGVSVEALEKIKNTLVKLAVRLPLATHTSDLMELANELRDLIANAGKEDEGFKVGEEVEVSFSMSGKWITKFYAYKDLEGSHWCADTKQGLNAAQKGELSGWDHIRRPQPIPHLTADEAAQKIFELTGNKVIITNPPV